MKRMYICFLCLLIMTFAACDGENDHGQASEPRAETAAPVQTQAAEPSDSLAAFRWEMKPPVMAVADFGFPNLEGDSGIMGYLQRVYPQWLAEHGFVAEIAGEQTVETCGYDRWGNLLCIVPGDPESAVTVRVMLELDHSPYTREVVAYQSETGEPILLLADFSEGVTVCVEVVSSDGRGVRWTPCWGIAEPIAESTALGGLVMDFSPPWEESPYLHALSLGWGIPEPEELLNTGWRSYCYAMDLVDNSVPDDNGGWVMLYDVGQMGEYTLSYTGSWEYEAGQLHLTLVPKLENGVFVDDSFPVLMLEGELWIGRSESGTGLPHFYEDQLADILEQPKG